MPIASISDFASQPGNEGANGRELPPYGPGGIYHEKQVGSLCAVHCANNLLQGPLFSEGDFREVAHQLDVEERRLVGGTDLDYGNARADGFFNVQVVQSLLGRAGYSMEAVTIKDVQNSKADTAKETAFILNKREHWFALRRLGREWFDLNSCLKTPRHYTDSDLRFHIGDAVKEGYMVYVVRGDFPRSHLEEDHKKLVEAIQGCGRPGQGHSLFAGSGNTLGSSGSAGGQAPSATVAAAAPKAAGGQSQADAVRAARLARFGGGGGAAGGSGGAAEGAPVYTPAAPVPEPPVVQAEASPALQLLVEMGFPREKAQIALDAAGGNQERAAEILLES